MQDRYVVAASATTLHRGPSFTAPIVGRTVSGDILHLFSPPPPAATDATTHDAEWVETVKGFVHRAAAATTPSPSSLSIRQSLPWAPRAAERLEAAAVDRNEELHVVVDMAAAPVQLGPPAEEELFRGVVAVVPGLHGVLMGLLQCGALESTAPVHSERPTAAAAVLRAPAKGARLEDVLDPTPPPRFAVAEDGLLGVGGQGCVRSGHICTTVGPPSAATGDAAGPPMVPCAIKCVPWPHDPGSKAYKHLVSEVHWLRATSHPHLVQCYAAWASTDHGGESAAPTSEPRTVYIAMEHMAGGTLQQLLDRHGPLPEREVAALVRPLAHVLHYFHTTVGVVHRDVKPANVLLSPDGGVRLCDLGVARGGGGLGHTTCGTDWYMAPEILSGEAYGHKVDVYALGMTIKAMALDPTSTTEHCSAPLQRLIEGTTAVCPVARWTAAAVLGSAFMAQWAPHTDTTFLRTLCGRSNDPSDRRATRFVRNGGPMRSAVRVLAGFGEGRHQDRLAASHGAAAAMQHKATPLDCGDAQAPAPEPSAKPDVGVAVIKAQGAAKRGRPSAANAVRPPPRDADTDAGPPHAGPSHDAIPSSVAPLRRIAGDGAVAKQATPCTPQRMRAASQPRERWHRSVKLPPDVSLSASKAPTPARTHGGDADTNRY